MCWQVKVTDMLVRTMPRFLYPGEPVCAPAYCVISEALICLLRKLHTYYGKWTAVVNQIILEHLSLAGEAAKLMAVPHTKSSTPSTLNAVQLNQDKDDRGF